MPLCHENLSVQLLPQKPTYVLRYNHCFFQVIEQINSEWTNKQEELRIAGLSKKEALKLHIDQRKLAILQQLKDNGGPFSSAEQVEEFVLKIGNTKKDRLKAQKRLRNEVTYARDTSTSLPRVHH